MLVLDYFTLQRISLSEQSRCRVMLLLAITDCLPMAFGALTSLFSLDNPALLNKMGSIASLLYMMLAISRQPLNLAIIISQSRVLRTLGAALSLTAFLIFLYSTLITRTDYDIRKVEICSSRLPKSFDGYKILFIADFHIGTMLSPDKEIGQVVDLCNSLQPDMVAFGGDMVDIRHNEVTPSLSEKLSRIKSRDGVFSVTGNHDIGVYIRDSLRLPLKENTQTLLSKQRAMGWQPLEDETIYIRRNNDSIALTGIAFRQNLQQHRHSKHLPDLGLEQIYNGIPKETFHITLTHLPQMWDMILQVHPSDLTIAGHIHAMQMALQIGKTRLSPAMIPHKRWSGLYENGAHTLYINDGIGYGMYPMRVGAKPEITLLTLRTQ